MIRHTTLCLLVLAGPALAAAPAVRLTFEQHVRPILRAHCLECHGESGKPRGGLDLRLRRLAGDAIVAGKADESPLFLRVRDQEMPPGKVKLAPHEVDRIRAWIAQGAVTARPEPEKIPPGQYFADDERTHWAFQPIRRPAVPAVAAAANPVDAFLLQKLRENRLAFAPPANRAVLIRRLTFDLLGLPPTPEEVGAFVADKRPDAYERLVDRLLASPHYGERWGRHWLDVAGYADSHGYTGADPVRTHAWKYRDWVVRAFNTDLPLDVFILEQLAGDELVRQPHTELRPADRDRLIATGFLRTAPDGTASPGVDVRVAANQAVADTLQIVSTALLGVTMHCAQCHNHRFDPIPQADYYRLRAVFEPAFDLTRWRAPAARRVSLMTAAERGQAARIEKEAHQIDVQRLKKQMAHIERTFQKQLLKVPEDQRKAVEAAFRAAAKRTPAQADLMRKYPFVNVTPGSLYLYDKKAADELRALSDQAAKVRATKPREDFIDVLAEVPGAAPPTRLFARGDIDQPKEEMTPGGLTVLASLDLPPIPAKVPGRATTGRRLALAKHLTSGQHPLTARVLVNRFWMHHFGHGIVRTPGDFGLAGDRPSHPELLDWLADDLQRDWSLKRLHRMILTSAAYRQGWRDHAHARVIDPDNRLLWRAPLRRMEAEVVRDAMLAVAGRLNTHMGGRPVPVMPDSSGRIILGVDLRDAAGYLRAGPTLTMDELYRRSVYIQARRSMTHNVLEAFDAAQPTPCTERRNSSTVAQQALLMMNSDFAADRAREMAARVAREAGASPPSQVRRAYLLAFGRPPEHDELSDALQFLVKQPAKTALHAFCQALISSNGFLYVE